MDSRNGHRIRTMPSPSRDQLANAMQEHQRELARLERVRLDQPRPDADRFTNDYVDAPKLPLKKAQQQPSNAASRGPLPDCNAMGKTGAAPVTTSSKCSHDLGHGDIKKGGDGLDTDHFLTKQPRSDDLFPSSKKIPCAIHGKCRPDVDDDDLKKKCPSPIAVEPSSNSSFGIICPECGKCRCAACITPKKLPSHWLCNGTFECSAESLVDQLSCLCCVKAIFYHFPGLSAAENDEDTVADHPCTCVGSRSCQRWTVMGLLSVSCLPCLLCYWPCRAAAAATEHCYAAYHRRGCRCETSSPVSTAESSPVASIRPLTRKMTPAPPNRPGHARRISSGTTNSAFTTNGKSGGVFL